MSLEDRERWDSRHQRDSALRPRSSVLDLARAESEGAVALDLACGQGRHSLVLLERGYTVVATDVSGVALRRLLDAAGASAGRIHPVQADVDHWAFAADSFDLIVQVDFLDRRLFPSLRRSLRAGGLLLVDTFLGQERRNEEGPSSPEYLLRPGELREVFHGMTVLRDEECFGATARASFLARRS